ncbi:hypothetical protein K0F38_18055 [Bacteroides fragilis]|nr:hypothetical protein [Bacteroides fragilis]MCE8655265.1 hypothetical protein [Bacteroides fragilis]
MSRTIKDIYNEAIQERNKRLELKEFQSNSKVSIMNGITWAVAAVIHSFETLLDVFAIDISQVINQRVNGTPHYYVNALLQYQKGDELVVREDGLAFGYADVDETKRIISQVSYTESTDNINLDSKLILKVAGGTKGNLSALPSDELPPINSYINKLKFAGTRIEIISRDGDVLIPRVQVYYDGAVPEAEVYDSLEEKLNNYIMAIPFDSSIYTSKIVESLRSAEHVTDVYIDPTGIPEQGFFIASYDTDNHITKAKRIERVTQTNSGFLKQSTGKGEEKDLPNFREAIKLIIDQR